MNPHRSFSNEEQVFARHREDAAQNYFGLVRSEIAPLLPSTVRRIVDVGCGTGATSAWLKTIFPNAFTIGLEGNATLFSELQENVDEAHILDLNQSIPELGSPDLVLLLDVLEHLVCPSTALSKLVDAITEDATVIVSLPNVAHLGVAAQLFFRGRFDYCDAGILDRTHLRFFYRASACSLLRDAGLEILSVHRLGVEGPKSRLLNWLTIGLLRDRLTKRYLILSRKRASAAKADGNAT